MPFEPRLFRDDDDPRDLSAGDAAARIEPSERIAPTDEDTFDLPPELAVLGEQLGDDADHLLGCYPPGQASESPRPSVAVPAHRRARIIRWGGAAAAVLIGIVSWQLVARQWDGGDPPNRDLAVAVPVNSTPVALDKDKPVGAVIESQPTFGASGLPAAVFRGLTGAEQEAVLDLMQDDPQGRGELSI